LSRPNILVIMTDEHNPAYSSPYGHPFVQTPNIQRLAERGVVFDNAYCNSPLCVPSRASFMTGRYVHRTRVYDNYSSLSSNEPTWAHRLNSAGYDTALSGKMHFLGEDQLHGFQRRVLSDIHGKLMSATVDWVSKRGWGTAAHLHRFAEAGPGNCKYSDYDDAVTARAVQYLGEPERKSRPWALCVGLITPHYPLIPRQRFWDMYYPHHADLPDIPEGHLESQHPQSKRLREYFNLNNLSADTVRRCRAAYYGLVSFADERIGMVLDALERNGLDDNTLVVYCADHGEMAGEHGLWWKCSFYEGSSRVPFIVSWPKQLGTGRRERIVSLVDLTRTILEFAGCDVDEQDLDGASLGGVLRGTEADGGGFAFSDYYAHGTNRPGRMLRMGRYKLNYYLDEPVELFDIEADPGEFTDLAGDPAHAAVRKQMMSLVKADWDPGAIDRDVKTTQRLRRMTMEGSPHLSFADWDPATDNWNPAEMAAVPIPAR
jgi:choline-sulfatase